MSVPPSGSQIGGDDSVVPAVLAQALGSELGPGEVVACAHFVSFTGGRLAGSSGHGSHVVIVTDRRVIRVTAQKYRLASEGPDPATLEWPYGKPMEGGTLFRHFTWLGQIRDVERKWYWGKDRWLALRTFDGPQLGVAAEAETIVALETAIREALEGTGRWTLPPPGLR